MSPVGDVILKGLSNYRKLEHMNLTGNTLTDCMVDLLGGDDHPGFSSLKMLDISDSKLSRDDVMTIAAASCSGKLQKLEHLDLSRNCLTNCVRFLVDSITWPYLEVLIMVNAELIRSDLFCLSAGMSSGKLPKLEDLQLMSNNLSSM